ncbi:MAG: hypothetical protein Q9186_006295 [Xanthomendoza sp. 1 TL-2023]
MPTQGSFNRTVFPFLQLSGEIRNQIYLDIIGPKLQRPTPLQDGWKKDSRDDLELWPDRRFNPALFFLNRQINREFSDILWNTLSVEWRNDCFELDKDDVARFTSMKRLQRCTIILSLSWQRRITEPVGGLWYSYFRGNDTSEAMDVELTVFGLAHKLNKMPNLKEIHLEYKENDGDFINNYFLRYQDGSLVRWSGDDLKTVFGNDLRGMKTVQLSGTLCCECAALFISAMERPKEKLLELYGNEPDKCFPRLTVPQWSDKARGWI